MDNKNIKLVLSYDGGRYHGWQRQSNGVTIQSVVEEKLETMLTTPVKLNASGRTDAGVHAINQVCNFITQSNIDPKAIKIGLNSLLPNDILVKTAEYVPLDFHARYSVKSKVYAYRILNREDSKIFQREYFWHIRAPLNKGEMIKCLSALVGSHDFSSFRSSGSENTNPVRSILRSELYGPTEKGLFRIIIESDGFLRHMMRNIVGTVVEAGLGKINIDLFREILESKDRKKAGRKAPAQGLFLVKVRY